MVGQVRGHDDPSLQEVAVHWKTQLCKGVMEEVCECGGRHLRGSATCAWEGVTEEVGLALCCGMIRDRQG